MNNKEIERAAFYHSHNQDIDDELSQYKIFEAFKEGANTIINNLKHSMCSEPPMGELILVKRDMDWYELKHGNRNVPIAFCHEVDYHDNWKAMYSNNKEYEYWISVNDLISF